MSLRILSSCCLRQLSTTVSKVKLSPLNLRLISSIPVSRALVDVSTPRAAATNLQVLRHKSKKSMKKNQKADEEDEDEDEAEENEGGEDDGGLPGEKDKILKLGQVRTDKIFKQATNSARLIEEAFLEGRLYKNESKVLKKSGPVQEGDILDVVMGPDPKNPDFIKVHRIEIKEIKESVHSYVRISFSKNLTIKRYTS